MRALTLLFGAVALGLAGCSYLPAVGPDYAPVKLDLPSGYVEAKGMAGVSSTLPYWQRLGDPTLVALENTALAQSLTLKQAWQRIKQARAGRAMVMGGFGPQVFGQGGYEGQRTGAQANLMNGTTQTVDIFSLGVGAAWEPDVFGGNRRALESAGAHEAEAQAVANGMASALTAEVARQYVTYRTLALQRDLAHEAVTATETMATLVGHQARVGLVDGGVLARANAQAAQARMQAAPLEASLAATQHGLEAMLGQKPGTLDALLASPTALPAVPPSASLVLPSALILERPDLKAKERAVAAATADIGVAKADLFPRFSLTGSYGVQAPSPSGWDAPTALVWRGGPSFRWALFSMGRVWQNVNLQKAKQREAVLAYQQAALDALADVETNLARLRATGEALQAAQGMAADMDRQAALATLQHDKGAVDGLTWNAARLGKVEGEKAFVQARLEALLAYIGLHQSLGL